MVNDLDLFGTSISLKRTFETAFESDNDSHKRVCSDKDKDPNKNNKSPKTPESNIPNPPPDKNNDNRLNIPIFFFLNEFNKKHSTPPPPDESSADLSTDIYFSDSEDCGGIYCDHDSDPTSANVRPIPDKFIGKKQSQSPPSDEIHLTDLIELGKCYHCKLQTVFNTIQLEKLSKLVLPLEKLHQMIGMKSVKKDFVEQVVTTIQGFEKNPKELLHTILEGPPGVGKTSVVKILAEIYVAMGLMTKNIIKTVRRSDLIGRYLGHTAIKTQQAIDEARGGILIIDEAYALGNRDQTDSYSKECIDTLNQNLTEQSDKFICFVVGYEKNLNECFFSYNPGLRSRFVNKFTIESYDAAELEQIFDLKVREGNWSLGHNIDKKNKSSFFLKNKSAFEYYGRSVEILFTYVKKAHANRIFWEKNPQKTIINMLDIENGFRQYALHYVSKSVTDIPFSVRHIYQ